MGELDVSELMSVAEAIRVIDSVTVEPRVERVRLEDAQGYALAEDVVTDRDYPPFDKSLMDGFAVAGTEMRGKIIGEIAAGSDLHAEIKPGEAIAIMTGARVPGGTVGIVPVENVEVMGDQLHIRQASLRKGQHIAGRGSDARAGEIVLRKGERLEAAQLAVAASVGKTAVQIFARPRAAVLSTGDEIVPAEQTPAGSQIRDCNSLMLRSLLQRLVCQVVDCERVRDDRELLARQIADGMKNAEVLLISGGMSMGKYDYAPAVLKELGVELLITKLRIKPGKPFVFGRQRGAGGTRFVFGLPGNPVSAMICTLRLASRLFRRMQGRPGEERWTEAMLVSDLPGNGNREFYQPMRWEGEGVAPLAWKGSADIFTLARAEALLPRMENAPPLMAGERVRVMAIA